MSYGRAVSARGPALAAVSRAARKKMAQERGFERRGCGLALFFRCPTAAHRRKACHQTQRSVRRNRAAEPSCSERIDSRAGPAPPGAISGAAAPRAAPRRRKTRCHGAQPRPRGASLGPIPSPVPPGPTVVRQCDATARRSRDGARVRAPPNTPKWPRGRPRRRARASRRRKRSHRPQTRPRDVNLGPLSPPVPPGAALVRRGVVTARYGP